MRFYLRATREEEPLDTNRETAEVIAAWTVFVVPFLVLIEFLYWRDGITLEVIVIYWLPAVVLTVIGTIPPPWRPLTS